MAECGTRDPEPSRVLGKASGFDPRRVYTALLLIPALYGVIHFLPPVASTVLVFVISSLALIEYYRLFFHNRRNVLLTGIGLLTMAVWFTAYHTGGPRIEYLFAGVVAALLFPLMAPTDLKHHLVDSAVTVTGVLYIGVAMSYLIVIRSFPAGDELVLFLLLITWAADTGAYYVGKTLGRRPLAPAISPKKTVEGFFGGLGLAILAAWVARDWIAGLPMTLIDYVWLGSLITIAGLAGDLAESALKRSVGVKDSGGLLPGHGGMLDRIDSLLFTGPAFYYYVSYSGIPAS